MTDNQPYIDKQMRDDDRNSAYALDTPRFPDEELRDLVERVKVELSKYTRDDNDPKELFLRELVNLVER